MRAMMVLAVLLPGLAFGAERRLTIVIEDPRPVARAVELLESRHGWTITYEDPPWASVAEVSDVTGKVRTDVRTQGEATLPRVLVPRGGPLSFAYEVPADLSGRVSVLESAIETSSAVGNPGRFEVRQLGDVTMVVPTAVVQLDGTEVPYSPILDTAIAIPAGERTALDALEYICNTLAKMRGGTIVVGTVPVVALAKTEIEWASGSKSAREVILETLRQVGVGYSWQLFYDPGLEWFVLNVHRVSPLAIHE